MRDDLALMDSALFCSEFDFRARCGTAQHSHCTRAKHENNPDIEGSKQSAVQHVTAVLGRMRLLEGVVLWYVVRDLEASCA